MSDLIELDPAYSTTRRVRKVAPEVVEAELKASRKPEDQFETILFQPKGEGRKGEGGLRTKGYFKKSSEEKPLITVITVVFNGEKHLEETIQSVIKQPYDNVEYIIIDGSSTDKTLDIIHTYEHAIDYWISEIDEGIYYAMNKGIKLSIGKYIGLLNADDLLIINSLERIVQALSGIDEPGYTCGAVELIDQLGKRYGINLPLNENLRYKRRFIEIPCPHLGVFVSKSIYVQNGLYDTNFKLRADYDFILQLINQKTPSVRINDPVGKFRSGGASGGIETFIETFSVHKKHNVLIMITWFVFFRSAFKLIISHALPRNIRKSINKKMISKNRYD